MKIEKKKNSMIDFLESIISAALRVVLLAPIIMFLSPSRRLSPMHAAEDEEEEEAGIRAGGQSKSLCGGEHKVANQPALAVLTSCR